MNKNAIAVLAIAMALMAVSPVLASHTMTITISSNSGNTNVTGDSAVINVTSLGTIVFNKTTALVNTSYWIWKNQSGNVVTFNLSNVQNQTATPFRNLTWANFSNLAEGKHEFIAVITSNYTGDSHNTTIGLNISIDNTAPTITINQPTSSSSFSPLTTGNRSIDINVTLSDATTALDTCRVTIQDTDVGTVTVISNQTVSCSASSINLDISANSGTMQVIYWANDSIGNLRSAITSGWSYKTTGVGGGGTVSGGSGRSPIGSIAQITTVPRTGQASQNNNNVLIGIVLVGAIAYYVTRKKKRR